MVFVFIGVYGKTGICGEVGAAVCGICEAIVHRNLEADGAGVVDGLVAMVAPEVVDVLREPVAGTVGFSIGVIAYPREKNA